MDLREALADPRARLGLGVAGLLATADVAAGLVLARPGNPCGHRGFPGCRAARPPRILKS